MLEVLNQLTSKLQYIYIPVLLLILIIGSLWNLYFIKMARRKYKLYIKWLKKSQSDPSNIFAQWAYCYRTEFNKYLLLLFINVSECGAMLFSGIGYGVGEWLSGIHQSILIPQRLETHNCSKNILKGASLEIYSITEIPISLFIISISQFALILSMILSIRLMKYLHAREYNRSIQFKVCDRKFFSMIFIIAISIIVLGTVPQFVIIERFVESIVKVIVYLKWVKQIRRFHQTLKMLAFDCQINNKRKDVCRNALFMVKQFKIIMSLNIASFGLFILSELIPQFTFFATTLLYYGPCLFHYLYGTPFYPQAISSETQVMILEATVRGVGILDRVLIAIGTLLLGSHFFTVSLLFFGNKLASKLNLRYGKKYRTRFTPDLRNPLLIQPETNKKI